MLKKLIRNLEHQIPGASCTGYELDINCEIVEGFHVPMLVEAYIVFKVASVKDETLMKLHPMLGKIKEWRVTPNFLTQKIGEPNQRKIEIYLDLRDANLGELND
jgi:hypothetical protein